LELNFKIILIQKCPNIGLILIQKFDSKSLNSFCFEPKSILKIQKPIFNLPYSFICFWPSIPSGPIPFLFIFLCASPVAIGPHSLAGPSFGPAHHQCSPSSNRTRQATVASLDRHRRRPDGLRPPLSAGNKALCRLLISPS
jgi:hypothetical protein